MSAVVAVTSNVVVVGAAAKDATDDATISLDDAAADITAVPLSTLNAHPRDSLIVFYEPTHIYTINGDANYMSVTTWIHTFFPSFEAIHVIKKMRKSRNWNEDNQYFNMSDNEIVKQWDDGRREAAELGTLMHKNIENYYNGISFTTGFEKTKEYTLFKNYLQDHAEYKAYRTEWCVFAKPYKLAGSIDMVYIDPANPGKVIIADWKRSKEIKMTNKWERGIYPLTDIDNCNYWHYVLQLNVYRLIIEKYYDKQVSSMFLVILHPNQDNYIKITVPRVWEPLSRMLTFRKNQL